jgi:DNA repair protein RadD
MRKNPRDYQMDSHTALWRFLHDPAHYGKNPLVVMATGLGKSLNIAMFIWAMLSRYPHVRMVQACHVKELVASNYEEAMELWPECPAGVYAASLKRRDTRTQVTFAMINSVAKRAKSFGHVDFLIIDEAHRLSDNDASLYGLFIADLKAKNPNLIIIGYTATDYRMKGGRLTEMGLFDEVVYDIGHGESFLWAVEHGYLIRPVPTDPGFQVDDTDIGLSSGDYKSSEASAAMHDQDIIERAVDYSIKLAKDENRKRALIFAQSVDDADLIADMFTYKGYPTRAVHTRSDDRDEILAAHKRGELWGVTNRDILTTGYNDPWLDLMVCLRLTRSPGLWVQMVGRMTRPAWVNHIGHNGGPPLHDISTLEGRLASIMESGKLNARVLDFCGNTERLGPINYPNIPKARKKGAGGDAPVRTCKNCEPWTFHHTSVKVCPECGFAFPAETKLRTMASKSALVSGSNPLGLPEPEPRKFEVFSVHEMTATFNEGKGDKLDTMRVTYRSGVSMFKTWVCFEHAYNSFPRRKAEEWWREHGGQGPAPRSIQEALEAAGDLNMPKFINVWTNTKYPEITGYDFIGHRFEPSTLDLTKGRMMLHEPDPDPLASVVAQAQTAAFYQGGGDYWDDDIPF